MSAATDFNHQTAITVQDGTVAIPHDQKHAMEAFVKEGTACKTRPPHVHESTNTLHHTLLVGMLASRRTRDERAHAVCFVVLLFPCVQDCCCHVMPPCAIPSFVVSFDNPYQRLSPSRAPSRSLALAPLSL